MRVGGVGGAGEGGNAKAESAGCLEEWQRELAAQAEEARRRKEELKQKELDAEETVFKAAGRRICDYS